KYNLGQSMSRKGNCWDNATKESFFGHIKDEIDYKSCQSSDELQYMVDDYINYYNNKKK
ncbi:MAG: IS3 family transposase, partial [Terrisporobacter sp.]|uniref:IS3 family transposase n=1 Tax=Terrisporobacter sp. TaxID=1965305 RepID=UPI002FCAE05F